MKTLQFKTTIKCDGCVATVTPVLNKLAGDNNWKVDLSSPERRLSVQVPEAFNPEELVRQLAATGYKAEQLS